MLNPLIAFNEKCEEVDKTLTNNKNNFGNHFFALPLTWSDDFIVVIEYQ